MGGDGRAVGGGHVVGEVVQVGGDARAHGFVEGADGADQLYRVGNDVVADAAVHRTEADYRRLLRDVAAAADDGLRGADKVGGGDDRGHAAQRSRPVRLTAVDIARVLVRSSHTVRTGARLIGREWMDWWNFSNGV